MLIVVLVEVNSVRFRSLLGLNSFNWCTVAIIWASVLKGSVQRKLTWIENGVNGWILASDCGAGHYFDFLIRRHLVLNLFPFPLSTEKLLGEF